MSFSTHGSDCIQIGLRTSAGRSWAVETIVSHNATRGITFSQWVKTSVGFRTFYTCDDSPAPTSFTSLEQKYISAQSPDAQPCDGPQSSRLEYINPSKPPTPPYTTALVSDLPAGRGSFFRERTPPPSQQEGGIM